MEAVSDPVDEQYGFTRLNGSVCGLQGKPFPTPFAKPRGVGFSSPLVNFVWGFVNLAVALVLLAWQPFALASTADLIAFLIGIFAIGVFLARHFGTVQPIATAATHDARRGCGLLRYESQNFH